MLTAYQTLIRSDIDISYPGQVDQHCNAVVELKKSPLGKLNDFEHKITFNNNQYREVVLFSEKPFSTSSKKNLFAFQVKEVVAFHWERGSDTIYYIPGKKFTAALLKYWFLHIELVFYFLLEGRYRFLHAGAVEAEGKSLLFSAHSHGGKSTLTDYFIKQGHPLISDDKVAVYEKNNHFYAVPSHPHHRPHRGIEDLGFFVDNMVLSSTPIDALYRLRGSEPDSEITITELSGIEKFKALHFSNELKFFFQKEEDMRFLAKLAKETPVYEIIVPWELSRLYEVHGAIVKHSKTLKQPKA